MTAAEAAVAAVAVVSIGVVAMPVVGVAMAAATVIGAGMTVTVLFSILLPTVSIKEYGFLTLYIFFIPNYFT